MVLDLLHFCLKIDTGIPDDDKDRLNLCEIIIHLKMRYSNRNSLFRDSFVVGHLEYTFHFVPCSHVLSFH